MEDALGNLEVWKRGCRLAVKTYQVISKCTDFGFKDQMTRAAVSIPSNIAEGFERNSKKDFSNYLRIARGSCAELRTQIYIGRDIDLIDEDLAQQMINEALEISKMLQGLINRYNRKD